MNKNTKQKYTMTDEDLKSLKKSMNYVKKLNFLHNKKNIVKKSSKKKKIA